MPKDTLDRMLGVIQSDLEQLARAIGAIESSTYVNTTLARETMEEAREQIIKIRGQVVAIRTITRCEAAEAASGGGLATTANIAPHKPHPAAG